MIDVPEHPTAEQLAELRSEEHTSELQSLRHLVCRLLLEKKKQEDARTRLQPTSRHTDLDQSNSVDLTVPGFDLYRDVKNVVMGSAVSPESHGLVDTVRAQ